MFSGAFAPERYGIKMLQVTLGCLMDFMKTREENEKEYMVFTM